MDEPFYDPEDFNADEYREKILSLDAKDGIFWGDESPLTEEREFELKKYE